MQRQLYKTRAPLLHASGMVDKQLHCSGWYLVLLISCFSFTIGYAQQNSRAVQQWSSSKADTWVATDALGRSLPTTEETGLPRSNRYVGIFYFVWQGAHGYDHHKSTLPDEGVQPKLSSDTVSPYDITKLLAANPAHPQYGPVHAFHYWGEPYFGYYLPDDEWIIRKHAQMLSDAGIDVIIIDVTNAAIYLPQVTKIATTYLALRKRGITTPSFAFIINSASAKTANRLYENIYAKGLFKDLWFYWKGKPLLLCPPDGLSDTIAHFFTIRQSWAWSKGQKWFGNGRDKWTWVDHTPQAYGWHTSPDQPEQISVSVAEHPVSNIGRSFHDGREPSPDSIQPQEGWYFNEQWQRALQVAPEFVFVTGWNEWVAMRFTDGAARSFLGRPIQKGDTYFVDQYNAEYSRDAEPVKGAFNDNYYYQLVSGIRKYKGTRAIAKVHTYYTVKIDGQFSDWKNVTPVFYDDAGDTFHRRHPGWGRIKEYVDTSGRNDIVESRVATDKDYIAFYVKTATPLSSWHSKNWMNLYIKIADRQQPNWEGFHFIANRSPASSRFTSLEKCTGGWHWEKLSTIPYAAGIHELEIRIPKKALGIATKNFILDFKWVDNAPADGNVLHWLDKGDAAPNARYCYRYVMQKN